MTESLDFRRPDDLVYLVAYWGLALEMAQFLQVDGTWKHQGREGAAKFLRPEGERLAAEWQLRRADTIHLWVAESGKDKLDRHEKRPRKHDPRWDAGAVTADPCLSSPGWFSTRLAAGGVDVPCRLWLEEDRDEDGNLIADTRYFAEVDGKPCPDPLNPPGWPWRRIDEATWQWMTDTGKWDRQYDPTSPRANPTRAATESPKQYF